ncbi:MAG TPA: heavy metal translocating P-type ATPase [Kofleriaceae bacterium]|nr:heavy metal translocating P-type ATPase [Kofleriaceae bacterium]
MAAPKIAVVAPGCAHCGLPIPAGRSDRYCCTGCQIVHDAIAEHGLERFYELRDTAAPANTTGRSYSELDDPAFERVHVRHTGELARVALYLEDLRCTACVWLVESSPRCLPGVVDVRLDLGRARADVTWDPSKIPLSTIARHFDRLGHIVHPYRGLDRDRQRRKEDRKLLVKLGVAGAASGNLMLLAICLYAGLFEGMAASDETLFRWASMLVAVPAITFSATPFFRTAVGALHAKRLHLDLPLSIGVVAGLVWGTVNTLRGAGEIYFDSLSMLVFLLLVARWIVLRHQRRASTAAELLLALTPSRARRLDARTGEVTEVPIDALVPDDVVVVRVGETIPVDGVITRGESAIDSGLLTGESRPVDVGFGARVHAGTVNVAAPLEVLVTAVGEATRVGALVASIEALGARRAPIELLIDRTARRFVIAVTAAAALTLIGWSFVSVSVAAEHAMALLVVTCPCALALATPLAVSVALGRAARRGILIKGADALERLARPGTMFVDKTGTLTAGQLRVESWRGDLDAAELAAAVEAGSSHPIARAIAAHAPSPRTATEVREEIGHGITGFVDGHRVIVGSPGWVRDRAHARHAATLDSWIAELAERAETPIAIAVDGHIVAVAGLADPIRPDAKRALDALGALGWQIELLSGDDERVVRHVGAELGIAAWKCHGGVSPERKAAAVEHARNDGPVVMIGDGVNDAAAMAAASAGIAVSGAAEIAIEAADVYLRSPSIAAIADTAAGARATLSAIRNNLRWSLVYNLVAGGLAVTGIVNPLIAAVVMPLSSLTVLVSSLRSRAFREPSCPSNT